MSGEIPEMVEGSPVRDCDEDIAAAGGSADEIGCAGKYYRDQLDVMLVDQIGA